MLLGLLPGRAFFVCPIHSQSDVLMMHRCRAVLLRPANTGITPAKNGLTGDQREAIQFGGPLKADTPKWCTRSFRSMTLFVGELHRGISGGTRHGDCCGDPESDSALPRTLCPAVCKTRYQANNSEVFLDDLVEPLNSAKEQPYSIMGEWHGKILGFLNKIRFLGNCPTGILENQVKLQPSILSQSFAFFWQSANPVVKS